MIKLNNKVLTLILAVGVFGILNTEMGVVGIIPEVSSYFGVSIPEAALLVSGFALIVAFAGPTMPLIFSKVNRKTIMLLTLGIFSICNVASIFAPTFEILLALRIIPAAFHPLYTSMAFSLASQMGDKKESAKANARVFVGVSAGMVVGAPVASFLASTFSFEASMAFFAVTTIVVFLATVVLVPSMPVTHRLSYGSQISILRKPLLWLSMLSVVALNGAVFGFYGYLADFLGVVSGMNAAGVSAALLAYGLANIVGNLIAGRTLAVQPRLTIAIIPFALLAAFAALFAFGQLTLVSGTIMLALGVCAGIGSNVNQYLVSTAAPEAPDFANGLFLTSANLGVTIGAAFCGLFITGAGTQFAIAGSALMLIVAIGLIAARIKLAQQTTAAPVPVESY